MITTKMMIGLQRKQVMKLAIPEIQATADQLKTSDT
jgi:hypothetical protein